MYWKNKKKGLTQRSVVMKLILRSHKSSFQLFNYVADVTETSYWHWDDVVFLQGNSIFEAIKTMQQYHLFPIHLDTKIFGLIQFFFVLHCVNDLYIVISVILFHTIFMAWSWSVQGLLKFYLCGWIALQPWLAITWRWCLEKILVPILKMG